MIIKKYCDRVHHKLVEKTNPILGPIRRKIYNINPDFTIISNNCWAGSVYRWYNLPYLTPTAGLYFYPQDYNKFLSNLKYYLSLPPEQMPLSESKYKDIQIRKGQENIPIGKIGDDVEIIFLHYPTFDEAKEKWMRRAARVNWDNLIIKHSEMNGCTVDDIKEFDRLDYERKFIFTTRDYGVDSQIIFREYYLQDQVKDDTTLFNKYISIKNLVSGKPFK